MNGIPLGGRPLVALREVERGGVFRILRDSVERIFH